MTEIKKVSEINIVTNEIGKGDTKSTSDMQF